MTEENLVFRLFQGKRKEFLKGLETRILKKAFEESAACFFAIHPREDIPLWIDRYLNHADAISDGITKMGKSRSRARKRLYAKLIQYAVTQGFGEVITKEQEREIAIFEFLDFFADKSEKKEAKAIIDHYNQPRYARMTNMFISKNMI